MVINPNKISIDFKDTPYAKGAGVSVQGARDGDISQLGIEYTISQDDRYNTLDAENLVDEIFNILKSSTEKKVSSVIGYKQPSLEIQLEVFEPFINKLAIKQVLKLG